MKPVRSSRLLRRLSSGLIIIGGILLAYPLWSAGYAQLQQYRLDRAFARSQASWAHLTATQADKIDAATNQAARARLLARLFADGLRAGDSVGRLQIPRIGVNRVVLEGRHQPPSLGRGNDQGLLRSGPVHYGLTPLPGAGRPFAVAGHRTTYGAPFYRLNQLRRGDSLTVTTVYGRFRYRVAKLTRVTPSDISVLGDRGYDLVLTTCDPPYSADRRLIVWATLDGFALTPVATYAQSPSTN